MGGHFTRGRPCCPPSFLPSLPRPSAHLPGCLSACLFHPTHQTTHLILYHFPTCLTPPTLSHLPHPTHLPIPAHLPHSTYNSTHLPACLSRSPTHLTVPLTPFSGLSAPHSSRPLPLSPSLPHLSLFPSLTIPFPPSFLPSFPSLTPHFPFLPHSSLPFPPSLLPSRPSRMPWTGAIVVASGKQGKVNWRNTDLNVGSCIHTHSLLSFFLFFSRLGLFIFSLPPTFLDSLLCFWFSCLIRLFTSVFSMIPSVICILFFRFCFSSIIFIFTQCVVFFSCFLPYKSYSGVFTYILNSKASLYYISLLSCLTFLDPLTSISPSNHLPAGLSIYLPFYPSIYTSLHSSSCHSSTGFFSSSSTSPPLPPLLHLFISSPLCFHLQSPFLSLDCKCEVT